MKKYLFLAVAALGFGACAEKEPVTGPQNGELEQSYVAITIAADDMTTKAGTDPTGIYADGSNDERKVVSAYAFFFDESGAAFPVTATGDNYVSVFDQTNGFNKLDPENDNVSDNQNAVLVIQNH